MGVRRGMSRFWMGTEGVEMLVSAREGSYLGLIIERRGIDWF